MNIWPWSRIRKLEREVNGLKAINAAICDDDNWLVIAGNNSIVSDVNVMDGRRIFVSADGVRLERIMVNSSACAVPIGDVYGEETHA